MRRQVPFRRSGSKVGSDDTKVVLYTVGLSDPVPGVQGEAGPSTKALGVIAYMNYGVPGREPWRLHRLILIPYQNIGYRGIRICRGARDLRLVSAVLYNFPAPGRRLKNSSGVDQLDYGQVVLAGVIRQIMSHFGGCNLLKWLHQFGVVEIELV